MEKATVLIAIEDSTTMLCDAIAEKEGILSDREYDGFVSYINEMCKVQRWCETIMEAERLKKMLKE